MIKFKLKGWFGKKTAAVLIFLIFFSLFLIYQSGILSLIISPKFRGIGKSDSGKTVIGEKVNEIDLSKKIQDISQEYGSISFFEPRYSESFYPEEEKEPDFTTVVVPESLHQITGIDKKATYFQRIKAVDALGENLNPTETLALIYFLHKRVGRDYLKPLELNAVKNQVVLALMRQKPFPGELPMHLIAMYNDSKSYDPVWRDYCIQFLGQTYHMLTRKEDRLLVKKTILDSLKYTDSLAGPGIIALGGLAKYPGTSKEEVADEAYKIASNEKASQKVRIPALQIAAKYNHPQALTLARRLLTEKIDGKHGSVPVYLKMSAIAAIGMKGNKNDIALLEKQKKSSDIRLRTAAKSALEKL